ncbi:uncharacterized protein LOC132708147 [Cylas formicarius]|uniref:uncharacterized protein LOC132708147 n=1 Tax=Cylas formicarius TaxID=197179 RepID=UPI0029584F0D|nr:uncharacterized protein LOC132708147 [Cylas formicarius]
MPSLYRSSHATETCTASPKCSHDREKFPYKEFPPPAPPGGENAWDLQFCRWWGWNWVRKKKSGTSLENTDQTTNNEAETSDRRFQKSSLFQSQFQSKHKRQKKSIPRVPPLPIGQEHDRNNNCRCHQHRNQLSGRVTPLPTKRELKELCKCLVFKKPSGILPSPDMQHLYNTPSNSVLAIRKRTYTMDDQQIKSSVDKQLYIDHKKRKMRSWNKNGHTSSSEEVIAGPTSIYRPHSSTEDSVEYLTVKLQQIKSNICCPCREYSSKREQEPVKHTTEMQTLREAQEDKAIQTINSEQHNTVEKVLKYNGKKKKTICIMLCCCGSCLQAQGDNKIKSNKSKEDAFITDVRKTSCEIGKGCTNHMWTKKCVSDEATTPFYNKDYYESPLTGKTYSLGPVILNNNEELKLPELVDVNEDLECLKKLKSVAKSEEEHRVMLDAVCDAILSEHSQAKYNPYKLFNELICEDSQTILKQDLKNDEHSDFKKKKINLILNGSPRLRKPSYGIPTLRELSDENNNRENKENKIQFPEFQFKVTDQNSIYEKHDFGSTSPVYTTPMHGASTSFAYQGPDQTEVKIKKQTPSKYRVPRWSITCPKIENEIGKHNTTGDQDIAVQRIDHSALEVTIKKLYKMSSNSFELDSNVNDTHERKNYSIFSDMNTPLQLGNKDDEDSSMINKEFLTQQNKKSGCNAQKSNTRTKSANTLAGISRHYTGSSLIPVRKKSSMITNKKSILKWS